MMSHLAGRHVLLVEDEYFIANELRRAFEHAGAEVLGPVGRVADALSLIARAERLDGAVLDVNLNDVTVYPVADALRERAIPFVFATGYDQAAIPASYATIPLYEKPVEPARLAKALFSF